MSSLGEYLAEVGSRADELLNTEYTEHTNDTDTFNCIMHLLGAMSSPENELNQ